VLFDNVDTAKMHGCDTSNVSSRVESSQVEFGLCRVYPLYCLMGVNTFFRPIVNVTLI